MSAAQTASIRFRAGIGGQPVLQEMSPSAAHTFRPATWGAWLVGAASHPIAGDHFSLKVAVGVGCCAEVRSQSPTVARPGRRREAWANGPIGSSSSLHVSVGSDAMLAWRPEPGLATDGCEHRTRAAVQLSGSARLLWLDEILVERRSEARPGTWTSLLRVSRDGWPVMSSEMSIGPGSPFWESPAALEGARVVSELVVIDPGDPAPAWASARAHVGSATGVALPLPGPGIRVVAWGDDLFDCRGAIGEMLDAGGVPAWAAARWHTGQPLD